MQIIIRRGNSWEASLDEIKSIEPGELVYQIDKQGIYTGDGKGGLIRIAEVLMTPDGVAYARLPSSTALVPLCLRLPGITRANEMAWVVLSGYTVDGVDGTDIDSIWSCKFDADKRCDELKKTVDGKRDAWYEVEEFEMNTVNG